MVYLGILITRKLLASQKIFRETTAFLLQKWTFDRNYNGFEMKMLLLWNEFIFVAKLSSSCSSSQIQLNWDSPIISLKPPPPTHPTPPRERYFQFTQEAEIWYTS